MAGRASVAGELRDRRPVPGVPLRAQHVLLVGCALVLALTGLPQRLDFLAPGPWLMDAAGGIETLRAVHRGAGAVLVAIGLYHVLFIFLGVLANRLPLPLTMIPDARDYRDAMVSLLHFVGLREQRPALREPTYFQKVDYWVLAWGMTAMVLTGVIRLFPEPATGILSGNVVAAALALHSDVALLAVVWLVVIHLAYATLSPQPSSGGSQVAPMPEESPAGGGD